MATPPPNEAAKLAILRQQMMDKIKQDALYKQQTDRQYTGAIQPNPNWTPTKADGGYVSVLDKQPDMNNPAYRAYLEKKQALETDMPELALLGFGRGALSGAKALGEKVMATEGPAPVYRIGRYSHIGRTPEYPMAQTGNIRNPMYQGALDKIKLPPMEDRVRRLLERTAMDVGQVAATAQANSMRPMEKAKGGTMSQDAMQLAIMPKVQQYARPVTHAHHLEIEERAL
jgi:hypothetical protein